MSSTQQSLPSPSSSQSSAMDPSNLASALVIPDDLLLHAPQVSSLLRQFFAPMRTKWVVDFLFSPEAIHLPHFSKTETAKRTVLRSISTSHIEPAHMQRRRPSGSDESFHLQGSLLYLPVVTIDNITIGFGIMDAVFSVGSEGEWNGDELRAKSICTHFRFVREGNLGVLLEMYDLKTQDSVVMNYTRVESTVSFQAFKARFHRHQLLGIIKQEHTSFYFDKVFQALQSFETELQHRECPVCGEPPSACCDCRRDLPESTHPFDHAQFRIDLEHGKGMFDGIASKVRFEEGIQSDYTRLVCRTTVKISEDLGLTNRMVSWAIADTERIDWLEPEKLLPQGDFRPSSVDSSRERDSPDSFSEVFVFESQASDAWNALAEATFVRDKPTVKETTQGDAELGDGSRPLDEKDLKKEIRKQKNRESALRSNRRKKAVRDALERDLNNCKMRADQLRRREMHLRQENLTLRRSFLLER